MITVKKNLVLASLLITALIFLACLSGCEHEHKFSEWETSKEPTCTSDGLKIRTCKCDTVEEDVIKATGHTVVEVEEKAATCTENGYSASSYCDVCDAVIEEQAVIEALGHDYKCEVIDTATCKKSGLNKYTCAGCGDSYTESFSLPTYTAEEIYRAAVKYVGEIVTYDKDGNELALGAGFVISEDGKVATNYHVIEDAYSAKITINDVEYDIEGVWAYDAYVDIAVLKISGNNLKFANICSNSVTTGSTVYAIGSPKGLTNTYSKGIITTAQREIDGITYVQHDAAITAGNSGGPLVNEYGEVIGINTWTFTDSQNLNFAIFASELKDIEYRDLITVEEFYELENSTPYKKLRNWLIENGMYDVSAQWYYIGKEDYVNGGNDQIIFTITYDEEYDDLYTDLISYSGDVTIYAALYLNNSTDEYEFYFEAYYGESLMNVAWGYLDPATYSPESALVFEGIEGMKDQMSELEVGYRDILYGTLMLFEAALDEYSTGVTFEEFGFSSLY